MIWFTTMRLQGMLSLRSARIRRALSFTPSTAGRWARRGRWQGRQQGEARETVSAWVAVNEWRGARHSRRSQQEQQQPCGRAHHPHLWGWSR
jgi:hypothetical protein